MQIANCKLQIGRIAERVPKHSSRTLQFAFCILHFAFCNSLFPIGLLLISCSTANAHPILTRFYERTVDLRLSSDPDGAVVVEVKYQLEVNQLIALLDAKILLEQRKEEEPGNAREYYDAFTRLHASLLADRLHVILDDKALDLNVVERTHRVNTKDGTLHSDFLFRARTKPATAEKHVLTVEEGAYKEEAGRVLLSLHADPAITVLSKVEPSAELKARSPADLKIGDDEKMRQGSLTFTLPQVPIAENSKVENQPPKPETNNESQSDRLLDLLFRKDELFAVCLLLAAAWGAVHALSPGHGKTLAAAYLVGERGTFFHALLLGLSTTFAHTGAVVAIAIVIRFYPEVMAGAQVALRFVAAFVVVGLGFWMLYRRLTGRADHVHIGGGHHHHHHGHDHHDHTGADHYHDEHGHAHPSADQDVRWWNLIVLGLAGGIIPCPSAIVLLTVAIEIGAMTRALPLVLAFSAGLACVLVAIGMLVVTSKRFAGSHFGGGRVFQFLPTLSAILVTAIGLWLCYDAAHVGIASAGMKP
jgi:ABC-type nickel/cobalt efflux system permease component RcnA